MWGWGWARGPFMYPSAGWGLHILFWIVVLALLIGGAVVLVRRINRGTSESDTEDTALEILQKRYARGEIADEQFREMKKNLS